MKTILVAGSKYLSEENKKEKRNFAEKLGAAIVNEPGWRLLTGGAKGSENESDVGGIDYHAALGAKNSLIGECSEKEKIFTIVPRDNRTDLFNIGNVVSGRARSTQARRFELVSRADAVVIIEGHIGSRQIIEYSIASDTPVVPLACFGGNAREAFMKEQYRDLLINSLGLNEVKGALQMLEHGAETPDMLVDIVMKILRRLLRPSCFAIMPFNHPYSDDLWASILRPVIKASDLIPQRADEENNMKWIIEDIFSRIKEAKIVVADVTQNNANVMYELGYAHALEKPTIIICHDNQFKKVEDIPFDIRGRPILFFEINKKEDFKKKLAMTLRKTLECSQ